MSIATYMVDPPVGEERFATPTISTRTNTISIIYSMTAALLFILELYTRLRLDNSGTASGRLWVILPKRPLQGPRG